MNKKIKITILSILALVGFLSVFNPVFARQPDVNCNSATIYGNIFNLNGDTVSYWFEWGTNRSTVQNGNGTRTPTHQTNQNGEVSAYLSGLSQNTTYYYRLIILDGNTQIPSTTEQFTTLSCVQKPTLDFWSDADNSVIPYNTSTTLNWETGNDPETCTASGAWSGNKNVNGDSQSTGNLTTTKTYYLECTNSAGSSGRKSVTVNVASQPQAPATPTGFTATPGSCGTGKINLYWNASSGANYYTVKEGGRLVYQGGSLSTTDSGLNAGSQHTYSLTASNNNGTSNATYETATAPNACTQNVGPTVTLNVDNPNIDYGQSTMIRWSSTGNDNVCTASGDWSGRKNPSGSQSTGNLNNSRVYSYTLTCENRYGSDTKTKTVTVGNPPVVTYTVNTQVLSGSNTGSFSPTSRQVNAGNSTSFSVNPAPGYSIGSVSGSDCGSGGHLSGNTYYTSTINHNCTVTASFTLNQATTYTVNTQVPNGGGSFNPVSRQVNAGSSATFEVIPNSGYSIDYVTGCGGDLNENTRIYTTAEVYSSCTIRGYFKKNQQTDTYTVNTEVSSGSGHFHPTYKEVNEGETASFEVNPSSGYSIGSVSGSDCGSGGHLSGNTYITAPIYHDCTITASFIPVQETYTVTASAGPGGNISPRSRQVEEGNNTTFTITPNSGYEIDSVTGSAGSGCDDGYLSGNTYYTGEIYENCSVYASFEENGGNQPTVNISASDTYLDYGEATYITWNSTNADSCYATGDWSGNKNPNGTYTYYTQSLYRTSTFGITCTNNYGSDSSSVTVYVNGNGGGEDEPEAVTKSASDVSEDEAEISGTVDMNDYENGIVFFVYGQDENQIEDVENDYDTYNEVDEDGEDLMKERVDNDLDGSDSYDLTIEDLESGEDYFYAICVQYEDSENDDQLTCGSVRDLNTDDDGNGDAPEVVTHSATQVDQDSATLNGYVDTNGEKTSYWFEWGTRSNSLYDRTNESSKNSSSKSFNQKLNNLRSNTTYYFRAVAESDSGTDYGNILSFTTRGGSYDDGCQSGDCIPTAVTTMATNIGNSSARLNGMVFINNDAFTTGYFEYGRSPSLGNRTPDQSIGNSQTNNFYASVFNLSANTTYYFRAVANNEYGISTGDIVSFRTGSPIVYTDTSTNTRVVYRNTTLVSNSSSQTNWVGVSKPSLVFLEVLQNYENIRRGDRIEYVVNYRNISTKELENVVLQISLPKELEFIETSRGYFSEVNNTVVVNIGHLSPDESGSVRVEVEVTSDAQIGKVVVVAANLAYTVAESGAQEEVFAYAKSVVEDIGISLGGSSFLFGSGFWPSSLIGWLLLILIILLLILIARRVYYGPHTVVVTGNHENGNGTTH